MIYGVGRGPDLPYPTRGHCKTVVNETHVMLIGGATPVEYFNAAYLMDWTTREWQQLLSAPMPISFHSCFTVGQFTYTVGGAGGKLLKYSHSDGQWTTLAQEFEIRIPETVVVDGRVLMTGTRTIGDQEIYEFDPENEEWNMWEETLGTSVQNAHVTLAFEK